MDEDESKVTPPSLASKVKSFASDHRNIIRPRDGGVGGTVDKTDDTSLKWKAGIIKSEAKDSRGKRKGKPKRGVQIEFKF
jgi:hypothetical protein